MNRKRISQTTTRQRSGGAGVRDSASHINIILDSMLDGVIIYDAEGRIVEINRVAQQILGYSKETQGLSAAERLPLLRFEIEPGEPLPLDKNPVMRALRGESVQEETYTIHPSRGTSRPPTDDCSAPP